MRCASQLSEGLKQGSNTRKGIGKPRSRMMRSDNAALPATAKSDARRLPRRVRRERQRSPARSLNFGAIQRSAAMRAATAPQPTGHPYLKASFQIGSIKGPTSYDQTTVVFHPDDIPAAKVQNKKDVKAWKKERSKGLGTSARWDMTVENPDPVSSSPTNLRHPFLAHSHTHTLGRAHKTRPPSSSFVGMKNRHCCRHRVHTCRQEPPTWRHQS